jgi:hypothetical protein
MTILQYARVAGIHLEDIVDDKLDLPGKLPGRVRHKSVEHEPVSKKKSVLR